MKKPKPLEIKWLDDVAEDDFSAARSYLSILYSEEAVGKAVSKLKKQEIQKFKAADIFRACELPLASKTDPKIKKEIKKITNGEVISPIIMMRDPNNGKVIIADGYHRMCAVHIKDEDALIPCKII